MDRRNWIQLSKTLIQRYKIYSLYSAIKNLPLQIFITAVSSFSGPIALLLDKNISHQFILPQNYTNSILILNCKGELTKTIAYNYKDKIIFMGFTRIQQLLIVEASGDYWLIDAFSGQMSQGNYSQANQKMQKYRGCILMPNNNLVMIRERQLGYTHNLTSAWQPLPQTKIKFENPIFSQVFNSRDEIVYLTKQNTIEMVNLTTNNKFTLYSDSYLNDNWQNLIAVSYNKERNLLGLVYLPHLILYVDLTTNLHKKFDPMFSLKYDLTSSNTPGLTYKYNSKSFYRPTNYTLSWLNASFSKDQHLQKCVNSILFFGNPKFLVMFDGQGTRMTPRSNCNQLISAEFDSIRVYTEDSLQIYRVVPHLYATVIEIYRINEGYYRQQYRKIIELHDEYTNFIEKDIIDLSKFDQLWRMGNRVEGNLQIKEKEDQNQKEQYEDNSFLNKQNPEGIELKIQKIEDNIIRPLIQSVRYCIDPVDQVKMLKFIFFIKNLYNSPINIYDLCASMRILNNLKFQFLNRTLTISQLEYLKRQENKDAFLTILLRYRMHFIGDIIFRDSDSKYKIFLHWAKCKIEKNNQSISYEEIKQKFQNTPKKNRDSKVFIDIAKYCLDRGKLGLAERIIQLDENPDRKIMVYLLMLSSTTDKKLVSKLILTAQQSSKSFLIYRVIRQLLQLKWIQNSKWVNIFYQNPNVARHYVQYLKSHNNQQFQQFTQNYYLQNKDYQNLGLFQIQRRVSYNRIQQPQDPKYNQQALNNFIVKVQQFKQLLPNLYSTTKSFNKNVQMQLLRKVKTTDFIPSEDELKQVKNDEVLEYLGQIFLNKDRVDLAVSTFRKIKSEKVYSILMRKQKIRDALELAFDRKNKQAILEIRQRCTQQMKLQIEQRLMNLNKK